LVSSCNRPPTLFSPQEAAGSIPVSRSTPH